MLRSIILTGFEIFIIISFFFSQSEYVNAEIKIDGKPTSTGLHLNNQYSCARSYVNGFFFKGAFTYSEEPVLDQEVDVIFSISPPMDVSDVEITFLFPSGIELVSGSLTEGNIISTKFGNLESNEIKQYDMKIKVVKNGNWIIQAFVRGNILFEKEQHKIEEI